MSFAKEATDLMMQNNRFATLIWLALVALTLVTFAIGEAGFAGKHVMLGLLLIALIKGQMVSNYFMGLKQADFLWRAIMLIYYLLVGGLIAAAYLLGLQ